MTALLRFILRFLRDLSILSGVAALMTIMNVSMWLAVLTIWITAWILMTYEEHKADGQQR